MKEYISLEYIVNVLDEYIRESRGAEHFAYNTIKMEVLAAPGIVIEENDDGRD
jgi:hypothetical protein